METIRELEKFEKDFFLIFAHVEDDSGLWGALDGGKITELGKNELFRSRTAAFQKVRTQDKREKVKGWLGVGILRKWKARTPRRWMKSDVANRPSSKSARSPLRRSNLP